MNCLYAGKPVGKRISCHHQTVTGGKRYTFVSPSRCETCPLKVGPSITYPAVPPPPTDCIQRSLPEAIGAKCGCQGIQTLDLYQCRLLNESCAKNANDWERIKTTLRADDDHRKLRNCATCQHKTTVGVGVISHNYGRFLVRSIGSISRQTARASEVIVVDDSSDDNTREEAERLGVRYHRIDARNVGAARKAAFDRLGSEFLIFLDADDELPPEYIASGMARFTDYRIGMVHSDVDRVGAEPRTRTYQDVVNECEAMNVIHSGSIVRREAIQACNGFAEPYPALNSHDDWWLWRRLLRNGWHSVKQSARYRYFFHGENNSNNMRSGDYYDLASLNQETITLFTPLSGRLSLLPGYLDWLDRQTWPHGQVALILLDTSGDDAFNQRLRDWARASDYSDVRIVRKQFAEPGLADLDRRLDPAAKAAVQVAMAGIYSWMRSAVTQPYVMIVEDDILPPVDAVERLLRGMDQHTVSVSGAYQSRFHPYWLAWDKHGENINEPRDGLQPTKGNGFGCVLLRRSVIRDAVFTCSPGLPDTDIAFYDRLPQGQCKVDWSIQCEHRDA